MARRTLRRSSQKTLEKELGPGSKLEYNVIVDSSSAGSSRPYTVNMPTRNVTHNNKNEMGMPINLSNNIHNPFIIPGLKSLTLILNLMHHTPLIILLKENAIV